MSSFSNADQKKSRGGGAKALHRLHAVLGALFVAAFLAAALISYLDPALANRIKASLGLADPPASNADMSVHFVDVGQGDCELIICDGEVCLIDCGEWDMGSRVTAYLRAQNITKIKYFIISHQHTDHMGCADDIMRNFDIERMIVPQIPDELIPTNSVYEEFLDAVYDTGNMLYEANEEILELGSCKLYIYPQKLNEEYTSLNDYSLCVKAVHGSNTFLFSGDAERAEELSLVASGSDLSAKVMKVNHHGSSGSSTEEFLRAVGAQYAVIEVGADNPYGHPTRATMNRLKKHCEHIYRTDEDGTVVFESDGEGLNVITDKGR